MDFHFNKDFSDLILKEDHKNRPIWVCNDGHIFLETFSPIFEQAYDFLIAISEPICRPEFIHEYKITSYSLYAAASVGLSFNDIVSALNRLSKNIISPILIHRIEHDTKKCGKVKLVLRNGRYFIESIYLDCLNTLIHQSPLISSAILDINETAKTLPHLELHPTSGFLVNRGPEIESIKIGEKELDQKLAMGLKNNNNDNNNNDNNDNNKNTNDIKNISEAPIYLFEIDSEKAECVRRGCRDVKYPSLEEYDFRQDQKSDILNIQLKAETDIRPYQEKSLSKMFGNGRARSGIIVLPCGAGKTLVGITAACTIKKSVIVFATTGVSCEQWKGQFLKWSNLGSGDNQSQICMFTATRKDIIPQNKPCIIITTYSMVAFTQRRSREAERMMQDIRSREWGLVILDEVHVAPADMFRKCLSITQSRCKLGLTATLVREDEKIEDLFFMIGPKLYEADWMDLQRNGYIATVECIEVWCPMSSMFYREFLKQTSVNRKTLLQTMNPNKFRNCEYLIRYHEAKGDKIMVFSDNIFSLQKYAILLNKPYIYGKTSDQERLATLSTLQNNPQMNTIFISKVGDCSIDLPDVNVIIQISSHFSSRRQEAQRLGRILRPKVKSDSKAYFYTLVSQDTEEGLYAAKRQRFLVDQGYSFHVKSSFVDLDNPDYMYSKFEDRRQLLIEVMAASDSQGAIEADLGETYFENKTKSKLNGNNNKYKNRKNEVKVTRKIGSLSQLAGADEAVYKEVKRKRKKSSKMNAIREAIERAKERRRLNHVKQMKDLIDE